MLEKKVLLIDVVSQLSWQEIADFNQNSGEIIEKRAKLNNVTQKINKRAEPIFTLQQENEIRRIARESRPYYEQPVNWPPRHEVMTFNDPPTPPPQEVRKSSEPPLEL